MLVVLPVHDWAIRALSAQTQSEVFRKELLKYYSRTEVVTYSRHVRLAFARASYRSALASKQTDIFLI